MENTGKSFFELLTSLFKKYRNIIYIILAFVFIFLIINYEDDKISFSIESNWNKALIAILFIIIISIVIFKAKIFKRHMVFEEKELFIYRKLFGIKAFNKKYNYNNIYKILFGRYNKYLNSEGNIYTIYLDYNNQIIKVYTLDSYKECLEIIDEINRKTGKKVYDDTDICYSQEEDFFRNYYKLKKTFEEIKIE